MPCHRTIPILERQMDLRVLIVDDDEEFLSTARRVLERGGLTVVGVASTGSEALLRCEEHNPDVILVDVNLGQESGFDLVERVRSATENPPPVVLISLYAEEDLQDLLEASPALGFVSKAQLSAEVIIEVLGHGNRANTTSPD